MYIHLCQANERKLLPKVAVTQPNQIQTETRPNFHIIRHRQEPELGLVAKTKENNNYVDTTPTPNR